MGSVGADFVLRAYAIQIERQAVLQGFDLELRVITQRKGRFCAQSREFTHSDTLYLAKFNKLTVERRGTMLAEVISADGGKLASVEPSAMKVVCPVQKMGWSAPARSAFGIRAGALHSSSDSSPIIQQP